MAETVLSLSEPEFKDPPSPKFYSAKEFPGHYGAGMLSPYGEQLLWVIEHLVASQGVVDGPIMLTSMVDWADSFGGRPDHALSTVVQNVKEKAATFPDAGADDDQAHCFLKAIPVACLYAGKPDLVQRVTDAVRVHQNNDTAVAFGVATALLVQYILMHGKLPEEPLGNMPELGQAGWDRAKAAATEGLEELLLALSHEKMKGKEDSPFYDLAGRSCALPGSFIAPSYLTQQKSNDYVSAIRQNILGAGDTCSRAILLGGLLGALGNGPPDSWIEKVDKDTMTKIDALIEKFADIAIAGSTKDEL